MTNKPGTVLGRFLAGLLPEGSAIKKVAEAVDGTVETLVFDEKQGSDVPAGDHSEAHSLISNVKQFLLAASTVGVVKIDWPALDGDLEAQADQAAVKLVQAYINAIPD